MDTSFVEKFTLEKNLLYVMIAAILIVFGFIFYLFYSNITKDIQLLSPIGREEWQIGETYKIVWESQGVDRVGIALFKGKEPKWIAKNIVAANGEYDWKIHPGQEYRDDYWIAVFEYPWHQDNAIDYSKGPFAIIFPEFATCEGISLETEQAYIPSDYPGLRKVFLTEERYKGDLGGLEGADSICQREAEALEYEGKWKAFLGGDSDDETAVERMEDTQGGRGGIFVDARAEAALLRGATCHRLLGSDLTSFLDKFIAPQYLNEERFRSDFYERFDEVWLGRVSSKSKKNCQNILSAADDHPYISVSEKYSFTTTCQNWTKGEKHVEGYPVPSGSLKPSFPTCYTPQGEAIDAVASGGLGIEKTGDSFSPFEAEYCSSKQRLMCIRE